jgi:hypothetical protein
MVKAARPISRLLRVTTLTALEGCLRRHRAAPASAEPPSSPPDAPPTNTAIQQDLPDLPGAITGLKLRFRFRVRVSRKSRGERRYLQSASADGESAGHGGPGSGGCGGQVVAVEL